MRRTTPSRVKQLAPFNENIPGCSPHLLCTQTTSNFSRLTRWPPHVDRRPMPSLTKARDQALPRRTRCRPRPSLKPRQTRHGLSSPARWRQPHPQNSVKQARAHARPQRMDALASPLPSNQAAHSQTKSNPTKHRIRLGRGGPAGVSLSLTTSHQSEHRIKLGRGRRAGLAPILASSKT